MRRHLVLVFLGLLSATPAFAAAVSERADKVLLTIYQNEETSTVEITTPENARYRASDGIALVTETRTIDFPAGPTLIEFRGVMSTIVPQTVEIQGLPTGVLERNFDYDLLSPGSLLAKSIGQTVRLVRTDPNTGKRTEQTAIVRTSPAGTMLEIDGKLEALHCSGLPEKLVFEKIPDGLRDTPTLSVRVVMPQAGRYTLTLSYIATGLYWSADYNARISTDGRSLDLNGWITLSNFSSSGYKQVPVEVVAGNIMTTGDDQPISTTTPRLNSDCWPTDINWATVRRAMDKMSGAPPPPPPPPPPAPGAMNSVETVVVTGSRIPDPRRLGDYKLYQLPEPTDVASHQSKQIQFLEQDRVTFERVYTYDLGAYANDDGNMAATAMLRLQNTAAAGLGKPLPSGTVSVMAATSDGTHVLLGQHGVHETPTGLPVEIETGRAIDVRIEKRETGVQKSGRDKDKRIRSTFEVVIENDKSIPIAFELALPMFEGMQLIAEDQPHVVKPKGLVWSFAMPPGERETMHYTIEQPQR